MRLSILILFLASCVMNPLVSEKNLRHQPNVFLQSGGRQIFIPWITSPDASQSASNTMNVPYFPGTNDNISINHFAESAITWFGKINNAENYADLRFATSDEGVWVNISAFDRYLWYNPLPVKAELNQWDGVTLYLDTNRSSKNAPTNTSFQFNAALSWSEKSRADYQSSFVGNGSGWSTANLPFSSSAGFRGAFNENTSLSDSRGWAITFKIPYSSLGFAGKPPEGTTWAVGVVMHDRDSAGGPALADKKFPDQLQHQQPGRWASLHFGLPQFNRPAGTKTGQTSIRRPTAASSEVPDSAVGGTTNNLCPGDLNVIWNQWADMNFAKSPDFNIQNQSDVADWPCFSKYYISFPLKSVPNGKTILSATLVLHQSGQSGDPGQAQPSLIQISTVNAPWSESTITWNNAPQPVENVAQAWINPDVLTCGSSGGMPWPCVARSWDVSYAVAQAYKNGTPLQLVMYEADSHYHSGKHFTSSDTEDWNASGRPTLMIEWKD